MKVLKGLYYSKDHEWVKVEGEVASVGLTDYAQEHLGDIVYVELPEVDDEFAKDETFSAVESVKAASSTFKYCSIWKLDCKGWTKWQIWIRRIDDKWGIWKILSWGGIKCIHIFQIPL